MDGNTILRRSMSSDDPNQEILIEIDRPIRVGSMECQCPFRVSLAGVVSIESSAFGADEIQSVMLAFDALRELVGTSYPGATWFSLPLEMAFPRAIPYASGIETYREIEAIVDEELRTRFSKT